MSLKYVVLVGLSQSSLVQVWLLIVPEPSRTMLEDGPCQLAASGLDLIYMTSKATCRYSLQVVSNMVAGL